MGAAEQGDSSHKKQDEELRFYGYCMLAEGNGSEMRSLCRAGLVQQIGLGRGDSNGKDAAVSKQQGERWSQKYSSVEAAASLLSLEQPSSSKPRVGLNMQNLLLSPTVCGPLTSCPLCSAVDVLGGGLQNLQSLQGVLFAQLFRGIRLNQKCPFLTAAVFSFLFCFFLHCFFVLNKSFMQVIKFKECC